MHRRTLIAAAAAAFAVPVRAAPPGPFTFPSIDGGTLSLADWAGRPVLVVNTASLCGYTGQNADLQTLWDRYRDRGLVVLAVPSDDFRQELSTAAEVAEFCEITFGLDLPMTDITPVRGDGAHPFYRWMSEAHGFRPRWNFNKVLLGPDGQPVATWGSNANPMGREIVAAVEALLP